MYSLRQNHGTRVRPVTRASGPPRRRDQSDPELMAQVRLGDAESMNEVLRRYWNGVVGYAARFVEHPDAAYDLAQETFLRLWDGDLVWRETGTLRGFLYGVARNLARNESRRWREVRALALVPNEPSGSPTPGEELEEHELRRLVSEAVAALPPRRQEIFTLARIHRFSHAEIAQTLGISLQTVSNQMSAALTELRSRLREVLA